MMAESFDGWTSRTTGSFDPARRWYTITPSADPLNPKPKALWANGAGTMTAVGDDGTGVDFVIAAAGPVALAPTKVTAWTGTAGALKAVLG